MPRARVRAAVLAVRCSVLRVQTIKIFFGPVAQLVRAPPCHGGGRRFESDLGRLLSKVKMEYRGS